MNWTNTKEDTHVSYYRSYLVEITFDGEDFIVWDITGPKHMIGYRVKLSAAKKLAERYVNSCLEDRDDGQLVLA